MSFAALLAAFAVQAAAPGDGYEQKLVAWGLAQVQREVDPAPEGKPIDEILVASEQIVAPSDPYPLFVNMVHVRTKESVVRGEVLLRVGERYQTQLAMETERNLRRLFILATAVVLPVRGRAEGSVSLLIITKDLWSIRLNSEFSLVEGTLLQLLRVRPSENNFLGLNKRLSADFYLKLDTLSLGEEYADDRLLGSTLRLVQQARVIFNRQTWAPEGSAGLLQLSEPLRTLDSPAGYYGVVSWRVQHARNYRSADVELLPYPDATNTTALIPYEYLEQNASGSLGYVWSFGRRFKANVTALAGAYVERAQPAPQAGLTQAQGDWLLCNYLPRNQQVAQVGAQVRSYEARYAVLKNWRTFAISEDVQLGHSATLEAHWAPWQYGEAGLIAQYRVLAGDDLLTVAMGSTARFQPGDLGCGQAGGWVNQRVGFEVNNVSPVLLFGRFAVRAVGDFRWNDLDHRLLYLGGSNGLRGLLAEELAGMHMVLFNAEFRTLPVNVLTLHAGLVLFYDAGAAFNSQSTFPALVHTVGIGLRTLFPQFDKEPVRIDFGYVIAGGSNPPWQRRISASFGQIEELRPYILTSPL